MSKTLSVSLTTSLSPVAHGVLGALAAREDPASCAGNVVLTRLLREELERLAPGAWDELVYHAQEGAALPPRDLSKRLSAELAGMLRERSTSTPAPASDDPSCDQVFWPEDAASPTMQCVRTMGHIGTCSFRPWKRGGA